MNIFKNKTVLITGGTGSFGKKFTEVVLKKYRPKKLIIYSRDELKQFEMQKQFEKDLGTLRFFIGDIRDRDRLHRAFHGVDIIVHAAALKQVPALEYNPFEAVSTNVIGAENIINAAIDQNVKMVIALSSDKAVNPINLYGATKLCMEKLFVTGNAYSGQAKTKFGVVRYGNVVGSRGSVIPFFKEKKKTGIIPVTDERMTRFWMTLDGAVAFVISCLGMLQGGEIFVPKLPSMKVTDLARAIAPSCKIKYVGIRPGEKIYESLITEDESRHSVELKDRFVIKPEQAWAKEIIIKGGKLLPDGFRYTSKDNDVWLTQPELKEMAGL